MNQLHTITSGSKHKPSKRVGRGSAAGGGTTAGRGTKGQKARSGGNIPARFEGGQMPLIRRIGKKKGFKPHRKFVIFRINLKDLPRYTKDQRLVLSELIKSQSILPRTKVKILGEGDAKEAYQIQTHLISKSATKKIEAAGGKVEIVE